MKLVVGLGNPGERYARSRHNVGFMCLDDIGSRSGIRFSDRRSTVVIGQGFIEGEEVVLAKPRTFMNNSGEALSYLTTRFPVSLSDLLIVYDDMDLPLGRIRIRASGSGAGQKGMGSIIAALSSRDIPRIRIGIGRPLEDADEIKHVLGGFTAEEQPLIAKALSTARDAVMDILRDGLERAMNLYN